MLHIIGKEISRFHAIYWPAMLWSAGYDAPSHLLVTGFFTVDGQKMSKSIGNTIDPVSYIEQYSKDQLLLYLLQAFPLGEDGDFDRGEAIRMYNAKLANNIGNLLHRFTTLVSKFGGKITGEKSELDASSVTEKYLVSMEKYDLKNALQIVFHFADAINIYLAEQEPWKIRGEDSASRNRIEEILYTVGSGLRNVAIMLLPFFSEKMELLLSRIGSIPPPASTFQTLLDAQVTEFRVTERGDPLYVRVEEKDT